MTHLDSTRLPFWPRLWRQARQPTQAAAKLYVSVDTVEQIAEFSRGPRRVLRVCSGETEKSISRYENML